MNVHAVKGYREARYPTMEEHLSNGRSRGRAARLTLAVAAALLSTLLSGCSTVS